LHGASGSTTSIDLGTANAYSLSDHVKGSWLPAIPYLKDDLITYQGTLYAVAYPHTSASTFDENAAISGHQLYKVICRFGQGVMTVTTTTVSPNASFAGKYIRCTNAGGCIITLNPNVFAPADFMTWRQCGAGGLHFEAPTGVTLNGIDGFAFTTSRRGSVVNTFVVGAAEYDVFGFQDAA
jgi:hypothetical protein